MVGALGGVDAALEAVEDFVVAVVDLGHLEPGDGMVEALDVVLPELRFEGAETALEPLGGDEGIDQGAHFGNGGLVAAVIFGGEKFERRRVFAGNDLGLCVNAGFQGIEADCGLALGRAWACGFLRVGRLASICLRDDIDLTGDAEDVWKAWRDAALGAPTLTVADGLGGAGQGWGIRALESWEKRPGNGVTEKGLLRLAAQKC